MTKIAIEVNEEQNRQLKLLSMQKGLPSKAVFIQEIITEYLENK